MVLRGKTGRMGRNRGRAADPADRVKCVGKILRTATDTSFHVAFPDFGFLTNLPSPSARSTTPMAAAAAFSMAFSAFL